MTTQHHCAFALAIIGAASAANAQPINANSAKQAQAAPVSTNAPIVAQPIDNSAPHAIPPIVAQLRSSSPATQAVVAPQPTKAITELRQLAIRLNSSLSSKTAKAGDLFEFTTVEDANVDGIGVVPKGLAGTGIVATSIKNGSFGKPGVLKLSLNELTFTDGKKVALDGSIGRVGTGQILADANGVSSLITSASNLGGVGGAGMASVGIIAVSFLIKGQQAEISQTTTLNVNVKAKQPVLTNQLVAAVPSSEAPPPQLALQN